MSKKRGAIHVENVNMVLCDTDVMIEYLKGNEQTKETLNDIGA